MLGQIDTIKAKEKCRCDDNQCHSQVKNAGFLCHDCKKKEIKFSHFSYTRYLSFPTPLTLNVPFVPSLRSRKRLKENAVITYTIHIHSSNTHSAVVHEGTKSKI